MANIIEVSVYGDKYTYIQKEDGSSQALRYGEPWRDCTGDGLILAMAQEVANLRDELARSSKPIL